MSLLSNSLVYCWWFCVMTGRNLLSGIMNSFCPLYFSIRLVNEVMSTEQPCDLAYEFGDGMLNLPEYPQEYPKPGSASSPHHCNTWLAACVSFWVSCLVSASYYSRIPCMWSPTYISIFSGCLEEKRVWKHELMSLICLLCLLEWSTDDLSSIVNANLALNLFIAAKHPWLFNDQVVIYIRHVGPGVMVGQAWQEGKALQQVPKKLCSEILMVKDYFKNWRDTALKLLAFVRKLWSSCNRLLLQKHATISFWYQFIATEYMMYVVFVDLFIWILLLLTSWEHEVTSIVSLHLYMLHVY